MLSKNCDHINNGVIKVKNI